ncbi:MAG: 23S rRNA (guanosine(2251)-2'-O)-methyltransferase RlmB [Planctomyces sp.]|nr:23S rRNA (guanosine(2251)-2'-O)-methyltransferase RlmB [Planctomyces sp.]
MPAKRKQKLAGNHQKCWLWGRHLVTETMISGRWIPRKLILSEELSQTELTQIQTAAERQHVPVELAPPARLKELCRSGEHQGYVAQMPEFTCLEFSEFLKKMSAGKIGPLLILDRIQDPQNLGAMLRSAEVLGASAVIIGAQEQVGVTTAVARSSAGAINHIPVVQVSSLLATIRRLHSIGFQIVGTSLAESVPLSADLFQSKVAILIGNESTGVAPELLEACNLRVRIPQSGQLDSLNAAVAAGILLYAVSLSSK